jgi:hypothetical protein
VLCLTGEFGRDWRFDGSTEAVEIDFASFRPCAADLHSNHKEVLTVAIKCISSISKFEKDLFTQGVVIRNFGRPGVTCLSEDINELRSAHFSSNTCIDTVITPQVQ